jgi:hypothetical protein
MLLRCYVEGGKMGSNLSPDLMRCAMLAMRAHSEMWGGARKMDGHNKIWIWNSEIRLPCLPLVLRSHELKDLIWDDFLTAHLEPTYLSHMPEYSRTHFLMLPYSALNSLEHVIHTHILWPTCWPTQLSSLESFPSEFYANSQSRRCLRKIESLSVGDLELEYGFPDSHTALALRNR